MCTKVRPLPAWKEFPFTVCLRLGERCEELTKQGRPQEQWESCSDTHSVVIGIVSKIQVFQVML